jgi:molybdenum cofactor cytidylyltransferase
MHPVGVVLLAAGGSTRLGHPKQLLQIRGKSLLRHAIETALASAAETVVVVLGADASQLRREAAGLPAEIVENPNWQEGMGTSLRAGLAAMQSAHPEREAILFMVCDQPFVSATVLNRIIERHRESGARIVASAYGGEVGVPALFSRALFPELARLPGSMGAKPLLAQYRAELATVAFPGGEMDIDTEEDYQCIPLSALA